MEIKDMRGCALGLVVSVLMWIVIIVAVKMLLTARWSSAILNLERDSSLMMGFLLPVVHSQLNNYCAKSASSEYRKKPIDRTVPFPIGNSGIWSWRSALTEERDK